MRALGLVAVALLGVLIGINGLYMLLSPSAWFRLPNWLAARGSLTKERYAQGRGAIEVRITGAVMVAAIGWILYDMFASGK